MVFVTETKLALLSLVLKVRGEIVARCRLDLLKTLEVLFWDGYLSCAYCHR